MTRTPSRRTLLQHIGLGTATAITSPFCLARAQTARAQPADPVLDMLLRDLSAEAPANVLRPGAAGYSKIKFYNARFDCATSTTYLRPTSAETVSRILEWASANRRTLAVRGAGHSFEGKSSHPGLVVDMSRMTDLRFDRATGILSAQAGVQLGQVYKTLTAAGHVLPAGTCPTVGIAGHTLGGGIGDFLPMFGYMAQSLRTVTLVTMSGSVLKISDDKIERVGGPPFSLDGLDPVPVMTALRGGGQGTLGIVVDMTFKAHDVRRAKLGEFKLESSGGLSAERARTMINAWQTWRSKQSDEMKTVVSSKINFGKSSNSYSIEVFGIVVIPEGAAVSMPDVRRSLDKLYKLPGWGKRTPLKPATLDRVIKSFLDDEATTNNPERKLLYGSSSVLPSALPDDALEQFVRTVPSGVYVSFYTSGGATKTGRPTSLPPSEFLMEWVAWTPTPNSDLYQRVRRANLDMIEKAGFPSFGFPNYCDHDSREYFTNKAQLSDLRTRFDPLKVSTSSLLAATPPRGGGCPR